MRKRIAGAASTACLKVREAMAGKPPGKPFVIAICGGSGSGKSYFAERVCKLTQAERLNLDCFYHDRSHVPEPRRGKINFDDPRAIDWLEFEEALQNLIGGKHASVPGYDFSTHCRMSGAVVNPGKVIVADGLWLLRRRSIRRMADLTVFMDCPARMRLERRLERDKKARGRTEESVRKQFRETVEPMHRQYVQPQKALAQLVLRPGQSERIARAIAESLRELESQEEAPTVLDRVSRLWNTSRA